jgi:hypothetical protein
MSLEIITSGEVDAIDDIDNDDDTNDSDIDCFDLFLSEATISLDELECASDFICNSDDDDGNHDDDEDDDEDENEDNWGAFCFVLSFSLTPSLATASGFFALLLLNTLFLLTAPLICLLARGKQRKERVCALSINQ